MSGTEARGAGARVRSQVDADDPVLTAKVTVPRLPGWVVPCPRIEGLVAAGARGPLTLVTGPPGAGKTVAVASWTTASSDQRAVAWVTLDAYDNQPQVFWCYVVAALRRAGVIVPQVPSGSACDAVDHLFLVRLASVLAGQDPPVVLVLDDIQWLTDPVILNGLSYVLTNAQPGLRLVVTSRADPPLPLHRYRLAGELAEVTADDLAFSVRECALLLARHGVTLPAAVLESLAARTEGWAAGVRLAALSLHGHPDPEVAVRELEATDGPIAGYLVDEVLNAQPVLAREVLLRTSILDRVNADIASELTDDPRAGHVLPALARANGFVRPIGQEWYRYHSLFADVLRLKVRLERRDELADLYQRAARWHLRNGLLSEALRYAAESGDWRFASAIVVDELAIGQLIDPRDDQRPVEMLRQMSREGAQPPRAEPLLVLAAIGLSGPVSDASATSLAAAEGMLERLPADHEVPARLTAALLRQELSRRAGDLDGVRASAARAEVTAGRLPAQARARHPELLARVLSCRGTAQLWAGRLDAAADSFRAAIAEPAQRAWHEHADRLGYLALAEALQGQLGQAAGHAAQAARVAEADGASDAGYITPAASVALAMARLWQGDTQETHAQLKRAKDALRAFPDKLTGALAYAVAAQHLLATGNAATSLEMIRRARGEWSPSPPGWLELRLAVLESRAHVLAADAPAAVAAARRANPRSVPDAAAALACAWLAAGDDQAARQALEALTERPGEPAHPGAVARWLADARLSYQAGDSARGRQGLERALRLARPERVRLPFAMEWTWLRQVLRCEPELVRTFRDLLEPVGASTAQPPAGQRHPAPDQRLPVTVERLSEREQEVLSHLSEMLSTAEIAAEMCLSVNTVKTHLRSIYRKLSAARRGEAVRRARQLELI